MTQNKSRKKGSCLLAAAVRTNKKDPLHGGSLTLSNSAFAIVSQ
jgi:hypothetical protein